MNATGSRSKSMVEIGSRLEPFVDDWLIDSMSNLRMELHRPVKCEVALAFNAPWEGSSSAYVTVMKDEDRYRLYYRGSGPRSRDQVTCYAESEDGITWNRPSLGINRFNGSPDNNIIWTGEGAHNFMPFRDTNPEAARDEQYKALGGGYIGLVSPDGIHWKKIREEKIIDPYEKCIGNGDWIGQAFWDSEQHQYVAYVRGWRSLRSTRFQWEEHVPDDGTPYPVCHVPGSFRQVLRCTSSDFVNWTEPQFIDFGDTPLEDLYTNAATPYFRAPHIYLAFPKRFEPERKKIEEHHSDGVSDAVFMSSRDGVNWDRRFMEAFIRPGLDPNDWTQRGNMPAWGIVPTGPAEISLYYSENYDHPTSRLRRATLRTDGFVSVHAGYSGGDFVTRPIVFRGDKLVVNYSTSAAGSVKVEIQDAEGRPQKGYELVDSPELYGDEIDHIFEWRGGHGLGPVRGQPVRLKFVMKDADLYSIQFRG
jgi:hypothetical protein